jgi:hypothetical protein
MNIGALKAMDKDGEFIKGNIKVKSNQIKPNTCKIELNQIKYVQNKITYV